VRPSRPDLLTASGATSAAVHLSWNASQRGEAPLKAYRVTRDGAVYKQTTATAIDIPVANDKTYRFQVAAVDANNQLGDASDAVTVESGHTAPPTPAGLTATPSGEATVDLAWQPSTPARGRLAGYRVYRDGVMLRQTQSTSLQVANLGAATSHAFTVAAVDTHGWISPLSAPVTASTTPPVQTTGGAHAFLLASTDRSFEDFRAHYRQIDTVYPTYYDCDWKSWEMYGQNNPQITQWAQARGVKVLPRVDCQSGAGLNKILNDPARRGRWLDRMTALVDDEGYDGLNVDFEAGYATDRDAFTAFIAELSQRLHARGKLLSVTASAKTRDVANHPRSTFYDYVALSQYADHVFVMAWGIHWASSAPGAQDDARWETQVVDYLKTMPDPRKFVLGAHLYGMDWPNGGGSANPGSAYEYADVVATAARYGATPQLDPDQDAWHFSYTSADGKAHDVWFADAQTMGRRLQLARSAGIGIGFWRLGNEDQRMWSDPLLEPGVAWPAG
jgi:spore germination protein YaaH